MAPVAEITLPQTLSGFSREAVEALSEVRGEPEWLSERRLAAWAFYQDSPLPDWRRMPLTELKLDNFRPALLDRDDPAWPVDLEAIRTSADERAGLLIYRSSGRAYVEIAPAPRAQGVILTDVATAVREYPELVRRYLLGEAAPVGEHKFAALHAALWSGGLFLYVPRNVRIEQPIHGVIAVDGANRASFPHTLVVADSNSSVTYLEETWSPADQPAYVGGAAEIYLAPGAQVRYTILNGWGENTLNLTTYRAISERDSFIGWTLGSVGGRINRLFIESLLKGAGSSTELLGIYFLNGRQHLEVDTLVNHVASFTGGDLALKGALQDEARSVFDGLIKIHPGAQDTNSYLSDQTLLLSDKARADSIPSLEIEANEVRASHGVTMGQVDEEQIFYLMSRGLTRPSAERMIVDGFFEPIMQRIPLETVKNKLRAAIERKFEGSESHT
jgi:Fe-S cluster assembly protein SufD